MTAFVEQVRGVQPPQSREWKILLPQAQNGNKYARERMVMMYTRSILRQAYDFAKAEEILKSCGFKYYTEFFEQKPVFKQLI